MIDTALSVTILQAPDALNPPNPTHITTDTEAVTSAEHASADAMVVHSVNVVAIHVSNQTTRYHLRKIDDRRSPRPFRPMPPSL